jgi:hypothetical protein
MSSTKKLPVLNMLDVLHKAVDAVLYALALNVSDAKVVGKVLHSDLQYVYIHDSSRCFSTATTSMLSSYTLHCDCSFVTQLLKR